MLSYQVVVVGWGSASKTWMAKLGAATTRATYIITAKSSFFT